MRPLSLDFKKEDRCSCKRYLKKSSSGNPAVKKDQRKAAGTATRVTGMLISSDNIGWFSGLKRKLPAHATPPIIRPAFRFSFQFFNVSPMLLRGSPLNPRSRRKPRRGRPYRFDEEGYKHVRSAVERFFAWLKSLKRITIRYERLASTFLALVQVACILIYLRVLQ
jgi:hypothetical protein